LLDASPVDGGDPDRRIADVAALDGAGPCHLAFSAGKSSREALAASRAGFCIVDAGSATAAAPPGMCRLVSAAPSQAFAMAARHFYPDDDAQWSGAAAIDPQARLSADVAIAPGVVIGPQAEIGEGTRIGPNTVIGRGVAIGRGCRIGSNVSLTHALVGDCVTILPGAQIGQSGFGFASGAAGHLKVPQLGRVIIQDDVEIGAATTIDRGALGDTVIGEGTKIDNLVQIGHNTRTGRHCIIVAQVGISGSCELGDFVVLGGQVGVADHVYLGDHARVAAKSGVQPGVYAGNSDYGGYPVRQAKDWRREVAALAILARRRRQDRNG
jgi:UDP-3-O-[3-hydroxymyristoyl] glucosamine N-acyltransferase